MNHIYACIDGLAGTAAVIEGALWAARRLSAPLAFLHVLERHPEHATAQDHSGAIGLGAQEALLNELSELDAQRGRLALQAGRQLLEGAQRRAHAQGLADVQTQLQHGSLADAASALEAQARLFVLGQHGRAARSSRLHLDHHVEQLVRTVRQPVLVVHGMQFTMPARAVIAFDGSATAEQAVRRVAASSLLAGLPLTLAMASADTAAARLALGKAQADLTAAGFVVTTQLQEGEPETVLPSLVSSPDAILVMGAYGHSRIRHLILGSTTTTLLRTSQAPVLVIR